MEANGFALLRNIRLADPVKKQIVDCDVLFTKKNNGHSRILEMGKNLTVPAGQPIKLHAGGGHLYSPAFVDTACYIPRRAGCYSENCNSATQAALAGGYGTVTVLPSVGNPLDTPSAITAFLRDCRFSDVRFLPVGSFVVSDRNKLKLADLEGMKKAGIVGIAPPDRQHVPTELVLDAMMKALELDLTVFCPVSGMHFSGRGAVNAGRISKLLQLPPMPRCAELLSVSESLLLAEESGCHIHIPVISLAESVEYIRQAKKRGINVTCGTATQYFSLTEDDLIFRGVNAKLDPPLRKDSDCRAIVEGLKDGTIDCIASDHRPYTADEKGKDLLTAQFGAAGLETAFAASFTYLVLTGKLDLITLIDKMTSSGLRVLGLPCGMTAGERMDIVTIDEEEDMIYTNNTLRGRGMNTPYYGTPLCGGAEICFIDGIKR